MRIIQPARICHLCGSALAAGALGVYIHTKDKPAPVTSNAIAPLGLLCHAVPRRNLSKRCETDSHHINYSAPLQHFATYGLLSAFYSLFGDYIAFASIALFWACSKRATSPLALVLTLLFIAAKIAMRTIPRSSRLRGRFYMAPFAGKLRRADKNNAAYPSANRPHRRAGGIFYRSTSRAAYHRHSLQVEIFLHRVLCRCKMDK